jgi:perosamine synthetase
MSRISWWRTDFGEEETRQVADAIAHEHISQGAVTAEFERQLGEFLGVPHVVATTSGSMAILMAMMAAGVGPGDEIIVPNRTWIATAHAPKLLGATVVLADVEPDRPIIDVASIKRKITPRTKVILPVHYNGRSADMRAINQLAAEHRLWVVEDAAQAFASRNADGFLGTQSRMGCFSLSVAKIIATGQGGYVVTKEADLARQLRLIRTHGVTDLINTSWNCLGFNFRFTDILASIGIAQLKKLPARIERLKAIYARYQTAMPQLPFLRMVPVNVDAGEIPIYVEVMCAQRARLIAFLTAQEIDVRPLYPDLDRASYLENTGDFRNSRSYESQCLYLPGGPAQPVENVDRVIDVLRQYAKSNG